MGKRGIQIKFFWKKYFWIFLCLFRFFIIFCPYYNRLTYILFCVQFLSFLSSTFFGRKKLIVSPVALDQSVLPVCRPWLVDNFKRSVLTSKNLCMLLNYASKILFMSIDQDIQQISCHEKLRAPFFSKNPKYLHFCYDFSSYQKI